MIKTKQNLENILYYLLSFLSHNKILYIKSQRKNHLILTKAIEFYAKKNKEKYLIMLTIQVSNLS